ncbi:MAG: phage terminase large subunit [Muribaculaceae bacterium]|nr:phage terminase large subunit [Muribaculaceae bacterium]
MKPNGFDRNGHQVYIPTCSKCGSTNIPEQILMGGSAGGGKQTLLDSDVCTPFGFRKLRDLSKGSIITNPKTGGMQKIIQLHPIETHPYYRVHFVDGTYVDCSEGHLWECHESRKKLKRAKFNNISTNKIWETIEMYKWYQRKKQGSYKGMHLIIPLTEPVKFTMGKRSANIDPYILGALIGDGSIVDTYVKCNAVQFTTMDEEIRDRFISAGYDMSHCNTKPNNQAKTYYIKDEALVGALKKLGIAGNRSQNHFIPDSYKMASIEDRISLMQGLIDTDGYFDSRGHIIYTSTSERLAEDVAFIVRSLGGVATVTQHKSGYKNEFGEYVQCSDHYDVQIRTKINPDLCGLKRKKERAKYEYNGGFSELGKRIEDIEYIGLREGRCITVDDPSGLYVVNDFTVTHNSYLGCCWLTLSCIQFEGIRMVVARRVRKTLLESTWLTLKNVLKEWGLKQDVHYHINNQFYTITFWNGSEIMAMELAPSPQDPNYNNLGSLEITGCFIDEVSEVPEKAVETLSSRIRYKVAETFVVGKTVCSTNPCLGWVRSTFVMTDEGDPVELPKGYRYIPFSLFDNPDEKFRAIYYNKLIKLRNKADRDRLLYGDWRFTTSNKMAAYWNFDGDKHLFHNLKELKYDKMKPLILSFDFNVNPYMSCLPIQINYEDKEVYVFPEYVGYPKDNHNNTPAFSRWVASQLMKEGHVGGVLLTGDPAGLARSTQTEEGVNNFTIANKNMTNAVLNPKIQLLGKQPAHITRLEFINELLNGYNGWKIQIDPRCHRLIEDFAYQKKNPDGTKEKKKVLNESGERVEKYGHFSDCLDYALIYYLSGEYSSYRTVNTDIVTTVGDDDVVYGEFDY